MSEAPYTIGYFIRHYRQARKWRQLDLADKAGVSVKHIENWEAGRRIPTVYNLARVAKALMVPMDSLIKL